MDIAMNRETVILDAASQQKLRDLADELLKINSRAAEELSLELMGTVDMAPPASSLMEPMATQICGQVGEMVKTVLEKTNEANDKISTVGDKLQEIGDSLAELATNPDEKGEMAELAEKIDVMAAAMKNIPPTADAEDDAKAPELNSTEFIAVLREAVREAYDLPHLGQQLKQDINGHTDGKMSGLLDALQTWRENAEIARLREENERLTRQATDLTAENMRLTQQMTDLTNERKTVLAQVQSDLAELKAELKENTLLGDMDMDMDTAMQQQFAAASESEQQTSGEVYEDMISDLAEEMEFPIANAKKLRMLGGNDFLKRFSAVFGREAKKELEVVIRLVDRTPREALNSPDAFSAYFLDGNPFPKD